MTEHNSDDLGPAVAADETDELDEFAETEPTGEGVRTGVPRVDAVLDSLAGLDDAPVDEHVAVFEQAHEQLRKALDAQPEGIPSALRPAP